MAKKAKEKTVFDDMPIEKWLAYIEENTINEEEKRELKVKARRSLTVENMAAYIVAHDNTTKAKRAFKNASIYTVKDENDNPVVDDDDNIIERKSVINAASYFVKTYIPDLAVEAKKKASAFDIIADW